MSNDRYSDIYKLILNRYRQLSTTTYNHEVFAYSLFKNTRVCSVIVFCFCYTYS